MLKLRTNSKVISLNDYETFFADHQIDVIRESLKSNTTNSEIIEVSLMLNDTCLDHELTLVCENRPTGKYFVIQHFFDQEFLHAEVIAPARAINLSLVFSKWKEMVKCFACAGLASHLSGEVINIKKTSALLKDSCIEKNVIDSKLTLSEPLKDNLFIKIKDVKLSLQEYLSKDVFYETPFNDLIHEWIGSYTSNPSSGLDPLKYDDYYESFNLITPNTDIDVLFKKNNGQFVTLPIKFQLGLNVENPTEFNDGECLSQWLLRITFQGTSTAYLKLGTPFEAGFNPNEEEFLAILFEAFECIDMFKNLMELLALEAACGLPTSIALAKTEFERLTVPHSDQRRFHLSQAVNNSSHHVDTLAAQLPIQPRFAHNYPAQGAMQMPTPPTTTLARY